MTQLLIKQDSFSKYLRVSESDSLSEYFDPLVTFDLSEPQDEYLGEDEEDEEPIIQSVKLSGKSPSLFSDDIYVVLDDGEGSTKFFILSPTNKNSFDINIWATKESMKSRISLFRTAN